jgi:hypothetical protein
VTVNCVFVPTNDQKHRILHLQKLQIITFVYNNYRLCSPAVRNKTHVSHELETSTQLTQSNIKLQCCRLVPLNTIVNESTEVVPQLFIRSNSTLLFLYCTFTSECVQFVHNTSTMTDRPIITRSMMMRSPPTVRKTSAGVSPVPSCTAGASSNNNSFSLDDDNDSSTALSNNDVTAILLEVRGITRKIDALNISMESIRRELKEEVVTRIDQNETNIAAHDQRLDVIEEAIGELRDESEAASRATDMVVKGIPMQQNENVVDIYLKIATAIGYARGNIPTADFFRLGRKRDGTKFDPPLLLRFATVYDKTAFHRNYFRHLTLNLTDIGFPARQRIYITENLTTKRQELYTTAMKLRRENQLHSVSTSNGRVMIRRDPRSRPIPVSSLSELDTTSGGQQQ